MTVERIFTKLISPYDIRDYRIAVSAKEFPETFELETVSVKNQGSTGSCVAHACSTIVEYFNKIQEKNDTVFSTEFIYGYRPEGYYIGTGMYLRDALKTLLKMGDVTLDELKGNHEYEKAMEVVNKKLQDKAFENSAYANRISAYMRAYSESDIKNALMNYGYVLASMPWHKDYSLEDGVYTYGSDELSGYHAVVIYGWNETGWLVQNSWGKNWGKKGKFVIPFDFDLTETWAITDKVIGESDVVKPAEKWWVKIFGGIINKIVGWFKNLNI